MISHPAKSFEAQAFRLRQQPFKPVHNSGHAHQKLGVEKAESKFISPLSLLTFFASQQKYQFPFVLSFA
jgi:hypothetical protein